MSESPEAVLHRLGVREVQPPEADASSEPSLEVCFDAVLSGQALANSTTDLVAKLVTNVVTNGMSDAGILDVVGALLKNSAASPESRRQCLNKLPVILQTERQKSAPPKLVPIRFIKGEVLRPREWIVRDWIPTRKVTLLQGDGGLGKSPLVQQLQSSCATASPWLGVFVEERVSLGFYTEDEEQDLKERQAAIDEVYGCACAESGKMHVFPRVGDDNELVAFDRARRPVLTPFYQQVCEAALDLRARLVVFDVAVDLFGGNEIARPEVRAFLRPLGNLARQIDGAVVLTSHVSQAGIRSDGGHSASTDWSNFVRSRIYLSRPKDEDGNEIVDARLLTRKKATYASIGDTLKLHWDNGLILPDEFVMPNRFRSSAEDVFLALLDAVSKEGQKVSAKPRAGNYAPTFFMTRRAKEREDYRRVDFERAMQDLLQRRLIKIAPYGPPSRGFESLVRADQENLL